MPGNCCIPAFDHGALPGGVRFQAKVCNSVLPCRMLVHNSNRREKRSAAAVSERCLFAGLKQFLGHVQYAIHAADRVEQGAATAGFVHDLRQRFGQAIENASFIGVQLRRDL